MNKTIDALKLAEEASNRVIETLEYLKTIGIHSDSLAPAIRAEKKALAAIREALAEEPVGYFLPPIDESDVWEEAINQDCPTAVPLYREPVSAEAIRAEALEEAVKFLEENGMIAPNGFTAASIRGLK